MFLIHGVVLYDDYIVFSVCGYIGVWKSSIDNSEHLLQHTLQHYIKVEGFIAGIFIHNGILYNGILHTGEYSFVAVGTWNIESGENIQEFTTCTVIT